MLKKILILLGILFVLGALGAGAGVWWIIKYTGEPVKIIRAQLDAINRDDYAGAYSYCSSAFKNETSAEEFRQFVDQYPVMRASDSTFGTRNISNGVATIKGSLTGKKGEVATVKYTLVKENDQWRIQHIKIGGESDEE